MTITHTSADQRGQIYVPFVNWALCIAVIALILGFRDSSNLASAYGIAVTGTFVITTALIAVVARRQWQTPLWLVIPATAFFGFIDLSFFAANLTKFTHGGWFPLVIAGVLFTVFMIWSRGLRLLRATIGQSTMREDDLRAWVDRNTPMPGTAIFLTGGVAVPLALADFLRKGGRLRENTVHVALLVQPVPTVPEDERLTFVPVAPPTVQRLEVRYGFMEAPNGAMIVAALNAQGVPTDVGQTLVVFHSTRVLTSGPSPMAQWRKKLFAFLMRNSSTPGVIDTAPEDLVMEWSTLVRL